MQLESLGRKFFLTACVAVALTGCGGPNFWPMATLTVVPTADFESDRKAAERIAIEMGFVRSPSENEGKIFWEDSNPWRMGHLYNLPSNTDVAVYTGHRLETGILTVNLSDTSVGGFKFPEESQNILEELTNRMRDEFGDDRVNVFTRDID